MPFRKRRWVFVCVCFVFECSGDHICDFFWQCEAWMTVPHTQCVCVCVCECGCVRVFV